ncbi:MAG: prepilin peptidase [Proteobacteria bacterium]|nr:prepilin peptidase [Candidatus Enterousia scatequi]
MFFYIFFVALLLGAIVCAYNISVADFRRRIIPDVYLFPLMLIGLVIVSMFPWVCTLSESVMGAVFGFLLASVIGIIFERVKKDSAAPIGMGDIKLISVGGLWMGPTGLAIALAGACVFGMLWAHRNKQKYIPFAPFFFMGAILSFIALIFLI